jgi:hypothetical protein
MNRSLQSSGQPIEATAPMAWTVGHVVALGLVIGMLLGVAEVFLG